MSPRKATGRRVDSKPGTQMRLLAGTWEIEAEHPHGRRAVYRVDGDQAGDEAAAVAAANLPDGWTVVSVNRAG